MTGPVGQGDFPFNYIYGTQEILIYNETSPQTYKWRLLFRV